MEQSQPCELRLCLNRNGLEWGKNVLKKHLNSAIEFHDGCLIIWWNKGYYMPHDVNQQIQMDIQTHEAVIGSQAGIPTGVRSNSFEKRVCLISKAQPFEAIFP